MSCVILGTHSQYLTPCSSSSFTLMTKGIYKKRKRKKKREKRSKKVKERGELTESSYSHSRRRVTTQRSVPIGPRRRP